MHIDNTQEERVDFMKLELRVLPEEMELKRLGKETGPTSQKADYLGEHVLPGILNQISCVQESLEETGPEDVSRLERLMGKKGAS